mgnify:CR=1 FL=1
MRETRVETRGDFMRYLNLSIDQSWAKVRPSNKTLTNKFLHYMASMNRKDKTLRLYRNDLKAFFIWNANSNENKDFIRITKEDFLRFRNDGVENYGWSEARVYAFDATLSSLSTYIENELRDDEHYGGYRSVIKEIKIKGGTVNVGRPEYSMSDVQGVLDMLVAESAFKEACLLALVLYSGKKPADLLKLKLSSFKVYADVLYKLDDGIYVLKEKFDPYLNLWLQHRGESEWLFTDSEDCRKPWSLDAMKATFAIVAMRMEMPMYWQSVTDLTVAEISKAGLPHDILWEMSGMSEDALIRAYVGVKKERTK